MNEHDAIEQLAVLLDEGGDPDTAPGSLGVLVTLAETVRDHADLMAPTPEFRAELREELVAAAEPAPGLAGRARLAWSNQTANLRSSTRVAVATMTASSMIGSAGIAVAAQEALPGDVLYGLKGVTEDARLLLAADDVAQARLHLAFARERLTELQATAHQLTTDEVVAQLAEMDSHSEGGAEALIAGLTVGAVDPDEVRDFTNDQRGGIVSVLADLPLLAKPTAEDSLELLRRIEITAFGITPVADCDCDPAADEAHIDEALAPDEPLLDSGRSPLVPTDALITAPRPRDGPAVFPIDCDCVELPGGTDEREPASEDAPAEGTDGDQEPEQEPFRPTGELTDPETSNDDEGDDERTGYDAPKISGGDVLVNEITKPIETTTGLDVDTEPIERVIGSLLSD